MYSQHSFRYRSPPGARRGRLVRRRHIVVVTYLLRDSRLCNVVRRTLTQRAREVLQRDDDEEPNRRRDALAGRRLSQFGPDFEFAARPGHEIGTDLVPGAQQHGGEELGVEFASYRHLAHDVEQHPHHVIEDGDHGATVRYSGGAAMPTIEYMHGNHAISTPSGLQAVTVRIVGTAPKTPRVVRLQFCTVDYVAAVLECVPPVDR